MSILIYYGKNKRNQNYVNKPFIQYVCISIEYVIIHTIRSQLTLVSGCNT